jgi:hypothetical protein
MLVSAWIVHVMMGRVHVEMVGLTYYAKPHSAKLERMGAMVTAHAKWHWLQSRACVISAIRVPAVNRSTAHWIAVTVEKWMARAHNVMDVQGLGGVHVMTEYRFMLFQMIVFVLTSKPILSTRMIAKAHKYFALRNQTDALLVNRMCFGVRETIPKLSTSRNLWMRVVNVFGDQMPLLLLAFRWWVASSKDTIRWRTWVARFGLRRCVSTVVAALD